MCSWPKASSDNGATRKQQKEAGVGEKGVGQSGMCAIGELFPHRAAHEGGVLVNGQGFMMIRACAAFSSFMDDG
jgi:hypothetical protein